MNNTDSIINTVLHGDALEMLKTIPSESVNTIVTSPPYYRLRDYGYPEQIGMEKTPELFIEKLVSVFREARRVLKDDGTLWVNIGDSYHGGNTQPGGGSHNGKHIRSGTPPRKEAIDGLKPKDLIGIPWMLAFALRADGWYLRQDIIWSKPNCMPESVTDRCTKSHEYIFMLSKSPKYYYDQDAIKEPAIYDVNGTGTAARKARVGEANKSIPTDTINGIRKAGFKEASKMNGKHADKQRGHSRRHDGFNNRWDAMTKEQQCTGMRNKRSVWTVSPAQFKEAHFATFPEKLIAPCIKAGCPGGGVVLDMFFGAGTTGVVASKLQRNFIGIEAKPTYVEISEKRISAVTGLFNYLKPSGV